jgi:cell division protein FtsI (penicillin-binding protein 3)
LNVLPDSNLKQMTLQDKNPTEIQTAAVKTNVAVLKR